MPARALKICKRCGVACVGPYCDAHKDDANLASRDRLRALRSAGVRRLYDSTQWRRRTVPYILARDPLCTIAVVCGGAALSTDVDHVERAEDYIAKHGGDQRYFFDEKNLRGACHEDHSRKTSLERRGLWSEPAARG